MEFWKEILFLLRHVPTVASRYKKRAVWMGILVALSVASRLVKNNFFASASTSKLVLHWTSFASLLIMGLLFALAFIDLLRNRVSLNDLILTTVTADAYYHQQDENAYELVEHHHYVNRTSNPISELPMIQDGYREQLQDWRFEYYMHHQPAINLRYWTEKTQQEDSGIQGLGQRSI